MNSLEYTALHSHPSIAPASFVLDAEARSLRRNDGHRLGPRSCDNALDPEREPPIGAHIIASSGLDWDEGVRRSRLRLGENRYHVLTNNCEHFCEWCACGEHRSYQVDELVARYGRACRLIELLARALRLWSTATETTRART
jgi:hypothetical protein